MDRVFEALASTARRKILAYLNEGELTAGDIGSRFDFSKPALSGHLRVLEEAGLVSREKRGQYVYFRLVPDRLANTVFAWAAEICPVAGPLKRESRQRARAPEGTAGPVGADQAGADQAGADPGTGAAGRGEQP